MDSMHEIEAQEACRREWTDGDGVDYADGEGIVPWPWIIHPAHARPAREEEPTLVLTAASLGPSSADRPCVVCGQLGEGLTCQDQACLDYLRGRLEGRPVRRAAS